MNIMNPAGMNRQALPIARTHRNHLPGRTEPLPPRTEPSDFRGALLRGLEDVNTHQKAHESLSVQAIVSPESVDAHDLTIAAAKANTSLSIAKNVVDRVVQAYRDITSLR
ncbi:flagellar hook-basal body complex protein FliE [Alkalispirochaeta americana]|uniref:Flagellar hook-basal body complex protein FliE n=1 Tax=Alkalispirochaeta americana TaxID=159291 RepID=A0A1N6PL65_9SPIO|nr:flagellar hook-basal body complex protein FliE [Alkalispirochaeta americana]SIQ05037.1 flagellar hook-basal body complex protein FliE [Alkalispirochaeta americana]